MEGGGGGGGLVNGHLSKSSCENLIAFPWRLGDSNIS